uniref:2Fe-2S ferredoxin-type domain-containing protein n=1 Tax=Peromyscus maniculatus bairdii TaxID=230844 RepID=A0A8C8UM04_PERMB
METASTYIIMSPVQVIERNADPEVNLLFYLRKVIRLTGTKYGCGGGGCGACTVMVSRYDPVFKKISHFSVAACLVPICSLHGAAVTTAEGIGSTKTRIHPVQERIAKGHGTQCGFCTPGMVMSSYALLRNHPEPSTEQLTETLGGKSSSCCRMNGNGKCCLDEEENEPAKKTSIYPKLYEKEEFQPLDPTQELIFPPELTVCSPPALLDGARERMNSPIISSSPPASPPIFAPLGDFVLCGPPESQTHIFF